MGLIILGWWEMVLAVYLQTLGVWEAWKSFVGIKVRCDKPGDGMDSNDFQLSLLEVAMSRKLAISSRLDSEKSMLDIIASRSTSSFGSCVSCEVD